MGILFKTWIQLGRADISMMPSRIVLLIFCRKFDKLTKHTFWHSISYSNVHVTIVVNHRIVIHDLNQKKKKRNGLVKNIIKVNPRPLFLSSKRVGPLCEKKGLY